MSGCPGTANVNATKTGSFLAANNPQNDVKHVIAVMSGKGGVGKSSVTGLMAAHLQKKDYRVGIMDADLTGPSIPWLFGISDRKVMGTENGLLPVETVTGIKVMSLNLILDHEDQPAIMRGPLISSTIKQFWTDVLWGDLDFLLVDLPPGTSDAVLTTMQALPLTGAIVVTSPQNLVNMIVKKTINMAEKLNIPVLGVVENMSYIECPVCGKRINVFGKSKLDTDDLEGKGQLLASLPIEPDFVEMCDNGGIEAYVRIDDSFAEVVKQVLLKLREGGNAN